VEISDYLVGGSSDAAFRRQYCSTLFIIPTLLIEHVFLGRFYAADCALPRSVSEDRQTGTGNSSSVRERSPPPPTTTTTAGTRHHHHHQAGSKSSHRSGAADRNTSLVGRSSAAGPAHRQNHSVAAASASSTSFHDDVAAAAAESDVGRRSSILQWTAASCNGREIFC